MLEIFVYGMMIYAFVMAFFAEWGFRPSASLHWVCGVTFWVIGGILHAYVR
jgi:hypothetical protein